MCQYFLLDRVDWHIVSGVERHQLGNKREREREERERPGHKNILMFRLRSKQCDSCKKRYCSKCCPKDNRGNITNDEGDILKRNARFCLQCKPMNLVFM